MSLRHLGAAATLTLVCVLGLLGAQPAFADVQGPCSGSLNGIDAASRGSSDPGDAVRVGAADSIDVVVVSPGPLTSYKVQLSFAGFRWTVAEDSTSGNTWSRTVQVEDYSRFGVGLYRVHAVSSGSNSCEGSMLVRVSGSPFATLAGWVALGLVGLGVGATVVTGRAGAQAQVPVGPMLLGGLGGLGTVALLQQFAVAYPTPSVAVLGVGVGAAAPLVASRLGVPVDHQPSSFDTAPNTWVPDRVVPMHGSESWSGPDDAALPSQPLEGGVEVRVLERVGGRVLVECSNGWLTWLDANPLEGVT